MDPVRSDASCPVCGAPTLKTVAEGGRGRFLHCVGCSTETCLPLPSLDDLKSAYQNFNAGQIAREDFDSYVRDATTLIRKDLTAAGVTDLHGLSMLDYGCGGGHFVKAAQSLGMDAVGMDLDAEDAAFGVRLGLTVEVGDHRDIPHLFGDRTFEAIFMIHVLEHVPEPAAVFRVLAGRLAPGGVFVLRVPDQSSVPSRIKQRLRAVGIKKQEWGFVQPPIHLHGYSDESFRHLAGANELEIVRLARVSPLDRSEFPSSDRYWRNLGAQHAVYRLGRMLGSGGHLAVVMQKPASA